MTNCKSLSMEKKSQISLKWQSYSAINPLTPKLKFVLFSIMWNKLKQGIDHETKKEDRGENRRTYMPESHENIKGSVFFIFVFYDFPFRYWNRMCLLSFQK